MSINPFANWLICDTLTLAYYISRFAYAVIAANQLVAVVNEIKFHYDDKTTYLAWVTGEHVDHAIWFGVVLVGVTIANLLPVRVSGLSANIQAYRLRSKLPSSL